MTRSGRRHTDLHTIKTLPEHYELDEHIDLQKDKKTALLINGIGLVIAVIMIVIMNLFVPHRMLFDFDSGMKAYFIRFAVLIAASIVYIVLHELTHSVFMKRYGADDVKFGFTGIYAYAGYPGGFFDRYSYIRISLAPLVVWGIVFTVICVLVRNNQPWLWTVYLLQIINVTGAAGDMYVTYKTLRYPEDVYIMDDGLTMSYYVKEEPDVD